MLDDLYEQSAIFTINDNDDSLSIEEIANMKKETKEEWPNFFKNN